MSESVFLSFIGMVVISAITLVACLDALRKKMCKLENLLNEVSDRNVVLARRVASIEAAEITSRASTGLHGIQGAQWHRGGWQMLRQGPQGFHGVQGDIPKELDSGTDTQHYDPPPALNL